MGQPTQRLEQQHIQQTKRPHKRFAHTEVKEKTALYKAVDFLDDFIPSWLILISIFVGLMTIALAIFRKQIKIVFKMWLGELGGNKKK